MNPLHSLHCLLGLCIYTFSERGTAHWIWLACVHKSSLRKKKISFIQATVYFIHNWLTSVIVCAWGGGRYKQLCMKPCLLNFGTRYMTLKTEHLEFLLLLHIFSPLCNIIWFWYLEIPNIPCWVFEGEEGPNCKTSNKCVSINSRPATCRPKWSSWRLVLAQSFEPIPISPWR